MRQKKMQIPVKVLEVNGIKISFLDYTYGTNNSGAGEGKEYMIDIFEKRQSSFHDPESQRKQRCIDLCRSLGQRNGTNAY